MKKMKENKQEEKQYERIVHLSKEAEKQASRFIEKNTKLDPQLQSKYCNL